jgi:hypothetical protein
VSRKYQFISYSQMIGSSKKSVRVVTRVAAPTGTRTSFLARVFRSVAINTGSLLALSAFLLVSARFLPRPFCDSAAGTCENGHLLCPVNGNCSNGVFHGCIGAAFQINGTNDVFCILPGTDEAAAWAIKNDVQLVLKDLPVMLPLDRIVPQMKDYPASAIATAVNFTGSHIVLPSGEIMRVPSVWSVIFVLVFLSRLCRYAGTSTS